MKEYGEKHLIDKIYNCFFEELCDYEEKLETIKKMFEVPKDNDIFLLCTKIKILTLDLMKNLDLSKVMYDYKTHLAHQSFNLKDDKVGILLP